MIWPRTTWPRPAGHIPRELRQRSKRLQRLLNEPGAIEAALATTQPATRPSSTQQVIAAATRQHTPPNLEARLSVAKNLVQLLQRFQYGETGTIAALFLTLDAEEAAWIQAVQATVELLQALLAATQEDQAEELFSYGISEHELPALAAEIQTAIEPYLR